jgi:hypothetical protein
MGKMIHDSQEYTTITRGASVTFGLNFYFLAIPFFSFFCLFLETGQNLFADRIQFYIHPNRC